MRRRYEGIYITGVMYYKRNEWTDHPGWAAHLDELQTQFVSLLQSLHLYQWMNSCVLWYPTSFRWYSLISLLPLTLAFQQGGSDRELGVGVGGDDKRFMSRGDVRMKTELLCQPKWKRCFYQGSPQIRIHDNQIRHSTYVTLFRGLNMIKGKEKVRNPHIAFFHCCTQHRVIPDFDIFFT